MNDTLSISGLGVVAISTKSISELLGEDKVDEFVSAAIKLQDLLHPLENAGINIHIWASENSLNYTLTDKSGNTLPDTTFKYSPSEKPNLLIKNAIIRGIYMLNKRFTHTINMIRG